MLTGGTNYSGYRGPTVLMILMVEFEFANGMSTDAKLCKLRQARQLVLSLVEALGPQHPRSASARRLLGLGYDRTRGGEHGIIGCMLSSHC